MGSNPVVQDEGTSAAVNLSTTPTVTQGVDTQTEYFAAAVDFNGDGTKAFYLLANSSFYEVSLSTAYDISTAGALGSVTYMGYQQDWGMQVGFSHDGSRLYSLNGSSSDLYYWNLTTDYNLSSSSRGSRQSMTWPGDTVNAKGAINCYNDDGSKFFLLSSWPQNGYVYEYNLSTDYDLTTASYSTRYNLSSTFNDPSTTVFKLDDSGLRFAAMDNTNSTTSTLYSITLTSAYDFSTASSSSTNMPHPADRGSGYAAPLGRLYYTRNPYTDFDNSYGGGNRIDAVQFGFTPGTEGTTGLRESGVFALGALGGGTGSPTRKWGGMQGRPIIAEPVAPVAATGGNNDYEATVGGVDYKFHEFTSNGSFTVTSGGTVDILLVGGGGGGGSGIGGGGGGGEIILAENVEVTAATFSVTVGAGGAGTYGNNNNWNQGDAGGGSSSFSASGFTTITCKGGALGGGGFNASTGYGNGGGDGATYSGGTRDKSAGSSTTISAGTHGSNSTYTIYSGGNGNDRPSSDRGAGGGGYNDTNSSNAMDGDNGVQILNFDQYSYYYGGGGGGAAYYTNTAAGDGGSGGGGGGGAGYETYYGGTAVAGSGSTNGRNNGGNGINSGYDANHGGAGGANTGGGGGGAGWSYADGGTGGSGIVIIRYQV